MPTPTITHLERRKIEAGVLIPMVQAFQRAIGVDRANEVAREVILQLARKDGEAWAEQFGRSLAGIEGVFGIAAAGGSLELERTEGSADELRFDVKQCGYADFFNALGLPELGYMFCCSRDSAMAEAFGGDITLERAHTIMEGANSCDFRFVRRG